MQRSRPDAEKLVSLQRGTCRTRGGLCRAKPRIEQETNKQPGPHARCTSYARLINRGATITLFLMDLVRRNVNFNQTANLRALFVPVGRGLAVTFRFLRASCSFKLD